MRRDFPFYERAKAVLEKNYRDALPELEKVKDDPDAIRDLVRKHVAKEREKLARVEELKAQRAAMQAPENRVAKKSREILAANKAKRMINAEQFEKVKQTFAATEVVDSGVKLNEAQLETLEKVFAGYNEAMAPMSLEDSVPVRVLKRLGLELDMGIDYRYNHLEREYQLKYYWSVSGNIATYGHELYKLGARYNEVSRSYEWISDDPSDSPLSTIMDRFGGEEYVEEARNHQSELKEMREAWTCTRSDVRLTGTYYKRELKKPNSFMLQKELEQTKNKNQSLKVLGYTKEIKRRS